MTLTAVSLFAGVGGFDLALQQVGVNVVAAVEIDDNARGVLAHRFPETQLFTDVCKVTGDQLFRAGFVSEHGILTGGFPCQDLSVAGKRAGLDGARSGLFWEICRIIDETHPKWLVLENVPGLLSSAGGRDMGAIVGALVDRGYGIAYRVLDAQHFGVPQRRRRVVIVGCAGDDGRTPAQVLAVGEGMRGDSAPRKSSRQEAAGTVGASPVARMRGFGDYATDGTTSALKARDYKDATDLVVGVLGDVTHALTASADRGASEDGTGHTQGLNAQPSETAFPTLRAEGAGHAVATYVKAKRAKSAEDDESWREDRVTPTLNAFDTGDTRATTVAIHPIQDGREVEKQQNGLGVGSEGDVRSSDVVVGVLGDHTHALTAEGHDASEDGTGRGTPIIAFSAGNSGESYGLGISEDITPPLRAAASGTNQTPTIQTSSVVRRLTPRECERLQGFPDDWTAERFDYKRQTVVQQADAPRYKQMGNAVAVPVFAWVMQRIVAAHEATAAESGAA